MFELSDLTKIFLIQDNRMSFESHERAFKISDIRDWCTLSIEFLQSKKERVSDPSYFDAALDRYQHELRVLNELEKFQIESVSYEALYRITDAMHLTDFSSSPVDDLQIIHKRNRNGSYALTLNSVISSRALFMRTGNPSYYVSALSEGENELRAQEVLRTPMSNSDMGGRQGIEFDKHIL